VRIFGHGGIAFAPKHSALYFFRDCARLTLANFCPQHVPFGTPAEQWGVISDALPGGRTLMTPATEWFALYRRE